jgi:hypothetical protein
MGEILLAQAENDQYDFPWEKERFSFLCNVSVIGVQFLCELFLLGNRFVIGCYFTFDHDNTEVFKFLNEQALYHDELYPNNQKKLQ